MKEHLQSTEDEKEMGAEASLGKVAIGDIVSVRYEDDEEPASYILVAKRAVGDTDLAMPTISIDSPLGQAVRDAKAGDTVTVDTPGGSTSVVIVEVQRHPKK